MYTKHTNLFLDQEQRLAIADNMRTYGGSFVKALGDLMMRADRENLFKLQETFDEYFVKYHPDNWGKKYKIGFVYQNKDGEYFEATLKNNKIVLQNPSYPFVFLPEVQQPLKEIGSYKEHGHLIEKKDYEFVEGETLTVEVKSDNKLKIVKD